MDVLEKVQAFIRDESLFINSPRILAAVSGGADSLCLLDCLQRLGFNLTISYYDHQVRPGSAQEADYMREIARDFRLPFTSGKRERDGVTTSAASEAELRAARYAFLAKTGMDLGCNYLATGHTRDDQIETVLMHFIRGAGTIGLRGMLPSIQLEEIVGFDTADLQLVRPLLAVSRDETQSYCKSRGLIPMVDETNQDLRFLRNRVRNQLLPALESYNPQVRAAIQRTSEIARLDSEVLEGIAEEASRRVVISTEDGLSLQIDQLRSYPVAIQLRIVRNAILSLGAADRDLNYPATRSTLDFLLQASRGAKRTIPGSIVLLQEGETARLIRSDSVPEVAEHPQVLDHDAIPISVPGSVPLAHGRRIEAWGVQFEPGNYQALLENLGSNAVAMEPSASALFLRRPNPGDRIRPLGMRGTKKLSDLFIDEGIDQAARRNWPVVVSKDKVLWVVGIRVAEETRLTDQSTSAVVLELTRD